MDMRAHVIKLNEARARVWEEAKGFLDAIEERSDPTMNGEERAQWERYNARLDEIDAEVRTFVERENREREEAEIREAHAAVFRPAPAQAPSEVERFASWARGETQGIRGSHDGDSVRNGYVVDLRPGKRIVDAARAGAGQAELRSLLWDTGSSGSLVPTDLSSTLYQYMTASVALMGMPTTKIMTDGGNPMDFPRVNAHGIATQVIAQGTAIGGTDPTFAKMTLDAYKYGQLLQLSSETIQDSGVDILGFVAGNIARAVGEVVATDLAVGTGTGEPNGVMTALVGAGTIATGGSLIDPTYEKLIDLVYSVNGNYRARSSTAWLMRDLTAANLRKLRDGAGGTEGAPLWQPSVTNGLTAGEPDRLLSYPVYTDPNVASLASNAKVIAFGDFSAYYIRVASGFVLDRSDDYAFNTDLVTFRGKTRVDGDLIDTLALNAMKRSV